LRSKDFRSRWQSILATDPSVFVNSGNIVSYPGDRAPYALTNKGIELELPIFEMTTTTWREVYFAILSCHHEDDVLCDVAIPIRHVAGSIYCRTTGPALTPRAVEHLKLFKSSTGE